MRTTSMAPTAGAGMEKEIMAKATETMLLIQMTIMPETQSMAT